MKEEKRGNNPEDGGAIEPYRLRLPGFITDEEIGLGDVIKRMTSAVGIKPCGGWQRRAAVLNRWMVISGRRSK
jgi:hypothetical protein